MEALNDLLMVWCPFGKKTLPKPVMAYCKLSPWTRLDEAKCELKDNSLYSMKWIWKCSLENSGNFDQNTMYLCRRWNSGDIHFTKLRKQWRYDMQNVFLIFCEGNPPVIGGFFWQRQLVRSFDVFCDINLNKLLRKQSSYRRFKTPWVVYFVQQA